MNDKTCIGSDCSLHGAESYVLSLWDALELVSDTL